MGTNLISEDVYNNLPPFLSNLTNSFKGRERDIVLLSSLGVLSAALPKVFGFYDGSKYSPNLYVLIIAPPASGKGIMNNSKKLIEKINQTIKEISLGDIEDCKSQKKKDKDFDKSCPDLEVKVIPGNVSSSKIYRHLKSASYGLLMFETEADTISIMLKQDWGNFSDILRKAFHHETISISRESENKFIEVDRPELSLVISGTPNQVKPLIQSKENGLFSRFMFYFFNDHSKWKDVSPNAVPFNQHNNFIVGSRELSDLYNQLSSNCTDLEIKLTDTQWELFNNDMSYITDLYINQNMSDMLSSIKRNGLIVFRICMILTVLRNIDNTSNQLELICDELDYKAAFSIMQCTIDHSIEVSNLLSTQEFNLPVRETILLSRLSKNFQRSTALAIGAGMEIPVRTLDFMLSKWVKMKVVSRVSNGAFEKIIK